MQESASSVVLDFLPGYFIYARRAMYVLSTWNAILGICPSEFMNALLSFRVSPSLLALSMTHVVAAPGVPSIRGLYICGSLFLFFLSVASPIFIVM